MLTDQLQAEIEAAPEQSPGFLGGLVRRAKRYAYAGLGAAVVTVEKASAFRHERVEKSVDRLAERGRESTWQGVHSAEATAQMARGLALGTAQQAVQLARGGAGRLIRTARGRLGIASAADVELITAQLDKLDRQLDQAGAPDV